MKCRHCGQPLQHSFLDLGTAPPSNAYLRADQLHVGEVWLPLRLLVCHHCWLVQTEDMATPETFFTPDYAYFSSTSTSWLAHARQYAHEMVERFQLNHQSQFVEAASNDGYLLQFFQERDIPCYGIEPTHATAQVAISKGLETIEEFLTADFARKLVAQRGEVDLFAGNNVFAHVPDINDFAESIRILLKPTGVATLEFPHLYNMVRYCQFDTAYHEHFSYLSLLAVRSIVEKQGLQLFDVQELSTHGGSLRVYLQRTDSTPHMVSNRVGELLHREGTAGMNTLQYYQSFQTAAEQVKYGLLQFLLDCKRQGKTVAAYGAAAKGNTLLNFAGVRPDLLEFVCDAAPSKQHRFMPGSRIPIYPPEQLQHHKPDYVVILPWNLADEISQQWQIIRTWGGQWVTAVPEMKIF
ncbi:MAG: class I SAM-dependent methyltransferase [Zavarzinella sp.]